MGKGLLSWQLCVCMFGVAAASVPGPITRSDTLHLTIDDTVELQRETGPRVKRTDPQVIAFRMTVQGIIKDTLKKELDDLQRLKSREGQMKRKVEKLSRQVRLLQSDKKMSRDMLVKTIESELLPPLTVNLRKDMNSTMEDIEKLKNTSCGNFDDSVCNMSTIADKVQKMEEKYAHLASPNRSLGRLSPDGDNNTSLRLSSVESGVRDIENNLRKLKCSLIPTQKIWQGDWCPPRLFVAIYDTSMNFTFHELEIGTNNLTRSPLSPRKLHCLTYDPFTKSIIFAGVTPPDIYSSPLGGGIVTRLRRNTTSYGMAVDTETGLLFISTALPNASLCRMTTSGEDFTLLADLSDGNKLKMIDSPQNLALDYKRQRAYVCTGFYLLSVSYSGDDVQIMYQRKSWWIIGVTIDRERDLLYFYHLNKIMRLTLSGGAVVKVGNVNTIRNLIYYDNRLYTAPYFGNDAINVLHDNGTLIDKVRVRGGSQMCLIS